MKKQSKYAEVRNDYIDDNGVTHIDSWMSSDEDAEGRVIALVVNGGVYYKDEDARNDVMAQEFINQTVSDQEEGTRIRVSAPELLEALKLVLDVALLEIPNYDQSMSFNKAEKAINNATN